MTQRMAKDDQNHVSSALVSMQEDKSPLMNAIIKASDSKIISSNDNIEYEVTSEPQQPKITLELKPTSTIPV